MQMDRVSTSLGVNSPLNQQQVKQTALLQELATGTTQAQAAVSGVDIAATAAAAKTSQAQSELAVIASSEENKLNKSVLAMFKNR